MTRSDWATWLVEEAGHAVIEKKAAVSIQGLLAAERLTYCLWVADYSMCNAGDLDAAKDLYAAFQSEGAELARALELEATAALFGMSQTRFEAVYFDEFEVVCAEVAGALEAAKG